MPEPSDVSVPESVPAETPSSSYNIQRIPIEKICPSPYQFREEFSDESTQTLAECIKQEGLMNPVIAREVGGPHSPTSYELIAGERRLRACKLLGWTTIPAFVITTVSEAETCAKGLLENLQREDLNSIEEAKGFARLNQLDPKYWTQEKIGEVVGKSQTYVSQSIGLLTLAEPVQQDIRRRILSRSAGLELARIKDPEQQLLVAKSIESAMKRDDVRKLVDKAMGKPTSAKASVGGHSKAPGGGEGGDPLADTWAELKHDPLIRQWAQWQVRHVGGYMWAFQADLSKVINKTKPEDDSVSPRQALSEWFTALAGALKPVDSKVETPPSSAEELKAMGKNVEETTKTNPGKAWVQMGEIMNNLIGGN